MEELASVAGGGAAGGLGGAGVGPGGGKIQVLTVAPPAPTATHSLPLPTRMGAL